MFHPAFRGTIISLTISALALLGAIAVGCGGEVSQDPHERLVGVVDQRVEEALEDIGATEQQSAEVHAIKDDLIDHFEASRAEHQDAHEQLRQLWLADRPDPQTVHSLVDERIDKARATAHKVADAIVKLHDILTPEQRQQLADRLEERRRRWHERTSQ